MSAASALCPVFFSVLRPSRALRGVGRANHHAPMTALSIIIVSFNAAADLERCLESIHAAPPATPHDIVVVDNGSTDRSVETARRWPDVRVVEVGANAGFARANNI